MGVTAAQLIARVSVEGVDSSQAKLGAMNLAVKATQGIFAGLGSGFGNIVFGLRNLGTAGTIGLDAISQGAVQMGASLWKIAGIAGLVGAAVAIAIGVISVKAAADFQQGLNRLRTGAGDTQDSFASLSRGMLKVSVDTGIMTGPLTQAMYLILSSGQRGAQAFATLAAAAKGAVIEQANVKDVANVLSGVMTNYGTKVFGATEYMNGLIKAVSLGKITLQQLAVAMGPIDPIAKSMGISFSDLAAAMTTQTNAMIPADRAATGLRFMMQQIENPTKKARNAMVEFGLDSVKVAEQMKVSLPGALQMIYDAAKKAGPEGSVPFNRAVSDMIGGVRSFTAYTALTGPHMKDFIANAQKISDSMKKGAGDVQGWALVQGNLNLQLDRVKAAGMALFITIGQQLLPVVTQVAAAIVPVIVRFTQWLESSGALRNILTVLGTSFSILGTVVGAVVAFFQKNELAMTALKVVVIALAGVIGGVMVFALYSMAVAAWAALAPMLPWIAVGAAVALAIAGIILVVKNWGAILAWLGGIVGAIGAWIGNVFSAMGATIRTILTGIGSFVGGIFDAIGSTIRDKLTGMKTAVGGAFSGLGSTVGGALDGVKSTVAGWGSWLYNHNYYVKAVVDAWPAAMKIAGNDIKTILNDIKGFIGMVWSAIGTFIQDRLTWIKNVVGGIWSAIGTFIQDRLTWIKNVVGGIWSAIGTFIYDRLTWVQGIVSVVWNWISSFIGGKANDTKNVVGNAFSALGTAIRDKITAAWNWLTGFVSGWPAAAFGWGAGLIQGLINGIGSLVGNFFSTLGGIADKIKGFLGFHSPTKEGAGKDADTWMPSMINMFTQGLTAGIPQMQAALSRLTMPLSGIRAGTASGSFSGPVSPYAFAGLPAQTPIVINVPPSPVYLDGRLVSQQLMPSIIATVRSNTGAKF